MMNEEIVTTFLSEPCPCDHCESRALCAENRLACKAYAQYYNEEKITAVDRSPNRRQYIMIQEGKRGPDISIDDISLMVELKASGMSLNKIAKKYETTHETIKRILHNKRHSCRDPLNPRKEC